MSNEGMTPLDYIRQSGNKEMLSYLRGMEVVVGRTEKTNDAEQGKTAYDYALETGNPEIIALMQNASRKR